MKQLASLVSQGNYMYIKPWQGPDMLRVPAYAYTFMNQAPFT